MRARLGEFSRNLFHATCDDGDGGPGHGLEDGGSVGVELARHAAQLPLDGGVGIGGGGREEQLVEAGVVQQGQGGVKHLL